MNIGLYQSASSLSALERWQDSVAQNISSSQTTGYRKRTINFSTEAAGELQSGSASRVGRDGSVATLFPKVNTGIDFSTGETQPTRRELDVAIQGEGFFEVKRPDGSHAYTRNGEFRLGADRKLTTAGGYDVLNASGEPIVLIPGAGALVVNQDGTLAQGTTTIGKMSVQKFADNSQLVPGESGFFSAPAGVEPQPVENLELLQGYIEGSNVTSLREMVDLVVISRAYEANQKMITAIDQQMGKTLDALG